MKLLGKLVNFTVTEEKTLSLKVRIDEAADDMQSLAEIKELKGETRKYTMAAAEGGTNSIYFTGQIKSINIVKGLMVVLHTPAAPVLVAKAIDMIGLPVRLYFSTGKEQELASLVKAAARLEGVEPEEIVYRLTTFSKEGQTIEGKRSIYDISESQQKVVLSKLHKMLSAKPT